MDLYYIKLLGCFLYAYNLTLGYTVKSHIENGIRESSAENFFKKRAAAGELKRRLILNDRSNNQHMTFIGKE